MAAYKSFYKQTKIEQADTCYQMTLVLEQFSEEVLKVESVRKLDRTEKLNMDAIVNPLFIARLALANYAHLLRARAKENSNE